MARTAIVDNQTGDLLALAHPRDPLRALPLPEGISARRVTLTDEQEAKLLAAVYARFTVDQDGVVQVTEQPAPAASVRPENADKSFLAAVLASTTVLQVKNALVKWRQDLAGPAGS